MCHIYERGKKYQNIKKLPEACQEKIWELEKIQT